MSNAFDFELRADDKVSEALKDIDERVRALQPELDKTRTGLQLGGQDTNDGLSDINREFMTLGRFAKENVQFIGDMVPPLKNFTGQAGHIAGLAGKLGLAGGAAYLAGKGAVNLASGLSDAADNAYNLQTAAANAGMGVRDFTQLSGAMRILGTDSETASQSIEGLYKTFNDALQGRNSGALAVMNQLHTSIVRNADGTANVTETLKQLADVFPRLNPQNQKTVADALGLDDAQLQLLREGARYKELLTKSEAMGLTVDPAVNNQLVQFNRSLTEVSASWDGLKQRTKQGFYKFLLSDGSVKNIVEGWGDLAQHGPDNIAMMHSLDFNNTRTAGMMRDGYNHPEFMKSLNLYEKVMLDFGLMTDGFEKKYQGQIGIKNSAGQLQNDVAAITQGYWPGSSGGAGKTVQGSEKVNPYALSVVNNNPWNIRFAGQSGAVPGAKGFARFPSLDAGVLNADRQLQLYASGKSANVDHPLQTLAEIISTASPKSDNNDTAEMIKNASRELGVDGNQPLNLQDVGMRSRVLAALFNQEGNNSLSAEQVRSILQRGNTSSGALTLPTPSLLQTQQQGDSAEAMKRALLSALQEQGMKVELTLINDKTGQKQSYTGSGSKVVTALPFP